MNHILLFSFGIVYAFIRIPSKSATFHICDCFLKSHFWQSHIWENDCQKCDHYKTALFHHIGNSKYELYYNLFQNMNKFLFDYLIKLCIHPTPPPLPQKMRRTNVFFDVRGLWGNMGGGVIYRSFLGKARKRGSSFGSFNVWKWSKMDG